MAIFEDYFNEIAQFLINKNEGMLNVEVYGHCDSLNDGLLAYFKERDMKIRELRLDKKEPFFGIKNKEMCELGISLGELKLKDELLKEISKYDELHAKVFLSTPESKIGQEWEVYERIVKLNPLQAFNLFYFQVLNSHFVSYKIKDELFPRFKKEMNFYLKRRGFSEEDISNSIQKLEAIV